MREYVTFLFKDRKTHLPVRNRQRNSNYKIYSLVIEHDHSGYLFLLANVQNYCSQPLEAYKGVTPN